MNIFQFMSDSPVVTVLIVALFVICVIQTTSTIVYRPRTKVICSHNKDQKDDEDCVETK